MYGDLMDEHGKIIRDNYPVENLPADLRAEVGATGTVRLTLERSITGARKQRKWLEVQAKIDAARASPHFKPVTAEEAVRRIRELRDEWRD